MKKTARKSRGRQSHAGAIAGVSGAGLGAGAGYLAGRVGTRKRAARIVKAQHRKTVKKLNYDQKVANNSLNKLHDKYISISKKKNTGLPSNGRLGNDIGKKSISKNRKVSLAPSGLKRRNRTAGRATGVSNKTNYSIPPKKEIPKSKKKSNQGMDSLFDKNTSFEGSKFNANKPRKKSTSAKPSTRPRQRRKVSLVSKAAGASDKQFPSSRGRLAGGSKAKLSARKIQPYDHTATPSFTAKDQKRVIAGFSGNHKFRKRFSYGDLSAQSKVRDISSQFDKYDKFIKTAKRSRKGIIAASIAGGAAIGGGIAIGAYKKMKRNNKRAFSGLDRDMILDEMDRSFALDRSDAKRVDKLRRWAKLGTQHKGVVDGQVRTSGAGARRKFSISSKHAARLAAVPGAILGNSTLTGVGYAVGRELSRNNPNGQRRGKLRVAAGTGLGVGGAALGAYAGHYPTAIAAALLQKKGVKVDPRIAARVGAGLGGIYGAEAGYESIAKYKFNKKKK